MCYKMESYVYVIPDEYCIVNGKELTVKQNSQALLRSC